MTKQINKNSCVEILCIGTELLLGEILNSNARWIAQELAAIGMPHYLQTVVGDNSGRIQKTVIEIANRSNILITTGGLGPTPDDLTTEALAEAFQTSLEERQKIIEDLTQKATTTTYASALCNRKQALLPLGANIIPNQMGTAPGMIWQPRNNFTIMTFPGVPSELKRMWSETGLPWLKEHGGTQGTLVSKVLKIAGIPESLLSDEIADLLKTSNPTVAPYASVGEVKLRLTAKAESAEEAKKLLVPLEEELRNRTGEKCYGADHESLTSVVLELLRKSGETLAVAESCTGGGIGASLCSIPGASDVFIGGVIAYRNSIKQKLLGVPEGIIKKHGAVSEPVVKAMAKGARKALNSDWAIAISGLAGPGGGSHSKPVGLVHIAIDGPKGCETKQQRFGYHKGRIEIQQLSVMYGLDQLRLRLLDRS